MKTFLAGMMTLMSLALAASGAEPPPSDVVILDHAKVAAMFAKGGPLLVNSSYKVQAGHREGPGKVEIHTADTDVFYILEGTATIITGGTALEPKETAPGEWRAEKSAGGTTRHLAKGDVIVIPAGVPHWMPEVSKPFDYFIVKVTGPIAAGYQR
jgi:quercetin dioxygenase-like cupin family protein